MKIEELFAKGQAFQDQELASAREWIKSSDWAQILAFWMRINDAKDGDELRSLSDQQLEIVRSFFLIGFFEATKSVVGEQASA